MNNCSVAIQILPQVAGRENVRNVVDQVIDYIKESKFTYSVGPFETTVEGPFDDLMDLVKNVTQLGADQGSGEVYVYCRIVYNNQEPVWTIDDKTSKHHK